MSSLRVRLREHAATDIEVALGYYLSEADADVTDRFIDAIERTINQISRNPQSGSLRFGYELEIPGLRARPVARFPYLVFYVVRGEAIDVWRILHSRRDVPSSLSEDADD